MISARILMILAYIMFCLQIVGWEGLSFALPRLWDWYGNVSQINVNLIYLIAVNFWSFVVWDSTRSRQ